MTVTIIRFPGFDPVPCPFARGDLVTIDGTAKARFLGLIPSHDGEPLAKLIPLAAPGGLRFARVSRIRRAL